MFDWFVAILHKPLAALTLWDIAKAFGALVVAAWLLLLLGFLLLKK